MTENVLLPENQNKQMGELIEQLGRVEKHLEEYRSLLVVNWQGMEIPYFEEALEQECLKLRQMITKLEYWKEMIGCTD